MQNPSRRHFFKNSLALIATNPLLPFLESEKNDICKKHKKIKPARLKEGDTVGLVAPASPFTDEQLTRAIQNLKNWGLNVQLAKNLRNRNGYLAGTDDARLADLHDFFEDDAIKAIWCARGGYGSARLLNKIDYKLIRRKPKILIGYSDITALLQAIYLKTGLVGFHAQVAVANFTEYTSKHLQAMLMEPKANYLLQNYPENPAPTVLKHGIAQGELIGGNLSLFTALLGTPFQANIKGKIIFLEDVGEEPYRIDRMFTQLRQVYDLNEAAGICLGIFEDCVAKKPENSLTLMQTLEICLSDLQIPIIYGMSFGHIANQFALPIGINAIMDTNTRSLTLTEVAVR